ncbi:MAG: P1 family peptidase [Armatimonadetes bacterium]|nr:P1 family peptidase [Armatimonadota bacterium]
MTTALLACLSMAFVTAPTEQDAQKKRPRELGVIVGSLPTGPNNAITDVPGVLVGHFTLDDGENLHTGATAILPHGGNLYEDKVPAAIYVGNGFGKLMGVTQVRELGEIETPIVLTNTLNVPEGASAAIEWTLDRNENARSVNAVVGETNDGYLNDIRGRHLTPAMIRQAIEAAKGGPVQEGAVGAGRGTICFGHKGGIGTASRRVFPYSAGRLGRPGDFTRTRDPVFFDYSKEFPTTVGVLVQTNFGGNLQILGVPIAQYGLGPELSAMQDGSIMIVVATDFPLSDRNLERLAKRALLALGKVGSSMSNGSGDYVIAFSTANSVRRTPERRQSASEIIDFPNSQMTRLFQAVVEATEEAIYNSLFMAETVEGHRGTVEALDVDYVLDLLRKHDRIKG